MTNLPESIIESIEDAAREMAQELGFGSEGDYTTQDEANLVASVRALLRGIGGTGDEFDVVGVVEVQAYEGRIEFEHSGLGDDCPLDGDHDSAMTSIGWGTDEDYGYYGGDEW